jgi:hypothetical protein
LAGRSRRRRRLLFVVLLLGGAGWYLRARLTEVREPWSSVPMPGEPVAPGEPAAPSPSLVSAAWAEPETEPTAPPPSPAPWPALDAEALFTPTVTVSSGVPAGPDGSAPGPEYTIKGNADSMLFHPPASPYYKRTRAEVWFRDADEARAAGFTEWTPKKRAAN